MTAAPTDSHAMTIRHAKLQASFQGRCICLVGGYTQRDQKSSNIVKRGCFDQQNILSGVSPRSLNWLGPVGHMTGCRLLENLFLCEAEMPLILVTKVGIFQSDVDCIGTHYCWCADCQNRISNRFYSGLSVAGPTGRQVFENV